MHEARFYKSAGDSKVDCFLCNHYCTIADGKRGFCLVRENQGGTLYTLTYGRLIAQHVDPIEKKPLYHWLPGSTAYSIATPGCNFRCDFCQNWRISQTSLDTKFDRIAYTEPEEVVREAERAGCDSISYTYTEPTIFMEYALDTAKLALERSIQNCFVTNGFESPEAVEAMEGVIQAANVDLKAFTEEFYKNRTQGRLKPVLETIRNMHEAGIHVEVTTLVVPGQNDSEGELRDIAEFIADVSPDIPWHISRFHPDYKANDLSPTPVSTLRRALELAGEAGLRYAFVGNVAMQEGQNTECPNCGRVVIRRQGFMGSSIDLDGNACPNCGTELAIVVK